MKKLMIAVLAGFMSMAVGAYAAEDMKKDPGMSKGEVAKSAMSKGDDMKKDMKKGEMKAAPAAAAAPTTDMGKDAPKKRARAAKAEKG